MSEQPAFTVIVPTYNRLRALEACLEGVARQDYPRERFQVVVVNDGGQAIPEALVESFAGRFDLRVYQQANGGPAAARNTGTRYAEGVWLAFTDDDCIPEPQWLGELGKAASCNAAAVLGGAVLNGVPENDCAQATHLLFTYLYEYYHATTKKRSQAPFFTSNNLALPRALLMAQGGFDAGMRNAEDRDICARLLGLGHALVYVPNARVLHYRPMDLDSFWRLHVSYGRGANDYHARQKERGADKIIPEPLSFYTGLVSFPARQTPRRDVMRLASLILLSQIANVYGFAQGKRRAPRRQAATQ